MEAVFGPVPFCNPLEVQRVSYAVHMAWWIATVPKYGTGVLVVETTARSNRLKTSGEMLVYFSQGMSSCPVPRRLQYLGKVKDIYRLPVYPEEIHSLLMRVGIHNYWDGMAGYSLGDQSTVQGVAYHGIDFYYRSPEERHLYKGWFTWLVLVDIAEPRFWYFAKKVECKQYRLMEWLHHPTADVLSRL